MSVMVRPGGTRRTRCRPFSDTSFRPWLTRTYVRAYGARVSRTSTPDLVAWQRSVAMAAPGTSLQAGREELLEVLDELVELRALVTRLAADGQAVARYR
jgi:hypothetical protein